MKLGQFVVAVFVSFFSLVSYADLDNSNALGFKSACTETWMQKAADTTDKAAYKNFGDKYCGCAAQQRLTDDAALQKAIRLCMSKTLMHDFMDSLEKEIGIAKAKDTDITQYCQKKWALVDPAQTDDDKTQISAYCACANPKLMDLIKQSETMTDRQYDDVIDNIASDCASNAIVQEPIS